MWVQEDFISKTTRKLYLLERELKVYDLGVPLVQSLFSRTYFAASRKSGSLPDRRGRISPIILILQYLVTLVSLKVVHTQ